MVVPVLMTSCHVSLKPKTGPVPAQTMIQERPAQTRTQPPPARIRIQLPSPTIEEGRWPVKRTVGDTVAVSADVFRDGHEVLRAVVRYRPQGARRWSEAPLHAVDAHHNGVRWAGEFSVDMPGRTQWTIQAWVDDPGAALPSCEPQTGNADA